MLSARRSGSPPVLRRVRLRSVASGGVADIDSARFRKVLGHFPTGVTVVTGLADGGPAGLTIGSFTSVSLDPPLVGFLAGKDSDSWPGIQPSGAFCVNVLGAEQAELCWRFAKVGGDKFDGVGWHPTPSGSPILAGAIAWIDCSIDGVYEMGDHWFILGRVVALDHVEDYEVHPLLFFRGSLGRFLAHE
jgi:3-hydroxy-9,10-secoandrosta-1,3,5(10)-triene-9,17-dione monooxygenase reductase component